MAQVSHLIKVFNVQCVMCGRAAGQLIGRGFVPAQRVAAPIAGRNGETRCGECGGNLYLEPEEAITPFMASQIAAQRAGALQQAQRAA
ncbi:MAG: hypothetical protein HYX52_06865 [Chloroflexi bacterium]|nr:hypothetical protein [Chloroflexota bacterium]